MQHTNGILSNDDVKFLKMIDKDFLSNYLIGEIERVKAEYSVSYKAYFEQALMELSAKWSFAKRRKAFHRGTNDIPKLLEAVSAYEAELEENLKTGRPVIADRSKVDTYMNRLFVNGKPQLPELITDEDVSRMNVITSNGLKIRMKELISNHAVLYLFVNGVTGQLATIAAFFTTFYLDYMLDSFLGGSLSFLRPFWASIIPAILLFLLFDGLLKTAERYFAIGRIIRLAKCLKSLDNDFINKLRRQVMLQD